MKPSLITVLIITVDTNLLAYYSNLQEPVLPLSVVNTQETKIMITYLIRVFDTTWQSTFWALKYLFLGQYFIFSCLLIIEGYLSI